MRRREVSDLKLVIEASPLFAIPDRILNMGNRVAFKLIVDARAMLPRRRPGIHRAVVLSI